MRLDIVKFLASIALVLATNSGFAADRPNILWISSEDNGQHLGCYGDEYADTPNLDAFAKTGMRYKTAWSNAPVCAPARTTIISGMYPPSTGSQHMRSTTQLPTEIAGEAVKMFPAFLREAGYYCTNASKEDYNLDKTGQVWDQSNGKAHWKNRDEGQPFFAVFNETVSHESKIRSKPHELVHDPAGVRVPAYHPDIPEVRRDWAQYYDKLTEMDRRLGKHLKDLEKAGLADETIVFYWGDHGSGMPRSKRTPLDSGLRVPMIVRFPDKFKHLAPPEYQVDGESDRLVSFVDLGSDDAVDHRYRASRIHAGSCVRRSVHDRAATVSVRISRPHGRATRLRSIDHRRPLCSGAKFLAAPAARPTRRLSDANDNNSRLERDV